MREISVRLVEESGTRWPIPTSWMQTDERVFRGSEGLLKLAVEEGDLIDLARCRAAEETRPGGWKLLRTRNGAAITGTYAESGTRVVVYSVRVDEKDLSAKGVTGLPEVQATYVLQSSEDAIAAAVYEELQARVISPDEHGVLDNSGHAAMGPVPLLRAWLPVGEYIDDSRRAYNANVADVYVMLVGGGWLMFSDSNKCCGFWLEPLAWRRTDRRRLMEKLQLELGPQRLTPRLLPQNDARVWQCIIMDRGFSYTASDELQHIRGVGAFWEDAFGQTWRLHYWLHREDGRETERLLDVFSASTAPSRGLSS